MRAHFLCMRAIWRIFKGHLTYFWRLFHVFLKLYVCTFVYAGLFDNCNYVFIGFSYVCMFMFMGLFYVRKYVYIGLLSVCRICEDTHTHTRAHSLSRYVCVMVVFVSLRARVQVLWYRRRAWYFFSPPSQPLAWYAWQLWYM